jgi:CTP:molybdopterin cytidylyltransferase MocA
MLIAILGAGSSSRFGGSKLDADCAGRPLGQWSLDAARSVGEPIIWIGRRHRPDFVTDTCRFLVNPNAQVGLGTSLALAGKAAQDSGASSLLVMLADMPLITGTILKRLVEAGPFAACLHGGRPGVPAVFPARLFADLVEIGGDRGAAPLLRSAVDISGISVDPESLLDVDTPGDLRAAATILSRKRPPAGWLDPHRRRPI